MAITKPFAVIPHPLGTVTSGNELASRPALHLGEFKDPGMVWQSSGASNLWVRGNFGSAKAVDFCSVLNANALAGTKIRIRMGISQAEVDGTATYDSGVLDFISPSITREDGLYHAHLEFPSIQTLQWWRIDITGHTGDFQAMALVLGKKATFGTFYNDKGFEFGQEDMGSVGIGRFGVVEEETGIKLRTLAMDFGWLSDSDRHDIFQPLRDKLGTTGMALWCFDPTATVQRQDKTYFGWLRKPAMFRAASFRHDRWQSQFDIRSII